jgi:hypothetical protein
MKDETWIEGMHKRHQGLVDQVGRVIISCGTEEQLKNAFKYVRLYFDLLDREMEGKWLETFRAYYSGQIIGIQKIKLKQYNDTNVRTNQTKLDNIPQ